MSEHRMAVQTLPDDGAVDLRLLGRRVAARKWWIIVPTLLAVAAMFAVVSMIKPRYTADAKVFLDNQESYYTRPDRMDSGSADKLDSEAVMSQVQLVSSREIAREAIRELKLADDPEFNPRAKGVGAVDRVLIMMGMLRNPALLSAEDAVLEKFSDRLLVFQVPKTRVLQIEFTSQKPELAASVANLVAKLYIKTRSSAKQDDTRRARNWLAQIISGLRPKVEEANLAVARFREQHGLLRGAGERTTLSQELGELVTKLSDARSQQSEAQAKSAVIKRLLRAGRIMDIPDVAKDDLIRRIAEQRVNLRAQLALELRTLLPGHPRVKELQSQVNALDVELRQAAEKVARTLDNDATVAASRIRFLDAEVNRRRQAAGEGGEKDAQLKMLEQEAATLDTQLQSAVAKFNDANARDIDDSTPPDVRLVSPATEPVLPTFPKKMPMLLLALLGGMLLSGGVVVTRELLSGAAHVAPTPRLPAQLGDEAALPVAARMREQGDETLAEIGAPRAASSLPDDAATFEEIAAVLIAMRREGEATRLLVTGVREPLGAQASLRLARAFARRGRAILVDLSDEAGATRALDLDAAAGLGELVDGDVSFAEAIHRDGASRLHVLPAGRSLDDGVAADAAMTQDILAALSATYDHIVVAGPASHRARALAGVFAQVDLIALVAALSVERGEARKARAALAATGVETLIVDASRATPGASDRDAA